MTPRPPRRPSAIARRASVTVSIAAERIGMSRRIALVRRVSVETWVGRMSLRAGIKRTSSKVRPSLANLSSRVNPPPSPGQVYRLEEDRRNGRILREVDRFPGGAGHVGVRCPGGGARTGNGPGARHALQRDREHRVRCVPGAGRVLGGLARSEVAAVAE